SARRQRARCGSGRRRRRARHRDGIHRYPPFSSLRLADERSLKRFIFASAIALVLPAKAHAVECGDFGPWVEAGCRHVVDTYRQGGDTLLVSGYEWHIPADWSPERRREENERAWGLGYARSREQPNGDTENVYFLVFRDSHRHAQFNL